MTDIDRGEGTRGARIETIINEWADVMELERCCSREEAASVQADKAAALAELADLLAEVRRGREVRQAVEYALEHCPDMADEYKDRFLNALLATRPPAPSAGEER